MASYAGREHEVIQLLKDAKQREQMDPQAQARAEAAQAQTEARTMLVNFYQERDPAKLAGVDAILQQYSGRENEIPNILMQTQASEKEHARSQLIEFYTQRDPSKLSGINHIMQQYAGVEWKIPKMLAQAPPAPSRAPAQVQAQVSTSTTGPHAATGATGQTMQVRRFSKNTSRRLSNVGTEMLREQTS